jgi:hypothetical protein
MTGPSGPSPPDDGGWRSGNVPGRYRPPAKPQYLAPPLPRPCAGAASCHRRPRPGPAPRRRSRKRGAITLSVVAVVAIGAGACRSSSPPTAAPTPPTAAPRPPTAATSLHFPAQLLGLSKNTSSVAQAAIRVFTSALAAGRNNVRPPQAAVYGGVSGPAIVVFGARFYGAAAQAAQSVPAAFDMGFAAGLAGSTGSTDQRSFPAGPHGGALYCGDGTLNGVTGIACGWIEKVREGFVLYLRGSASSLSDAASKTNQVRAAIEP